jgi:hypothetical protein
MRTTAQPGLARLVQGAHAAEVVSSEGAAPETTAVPWVGVHVWWHAVHRKRLS